jgi:hypothetical protein
VVAEHDNGYKRLFSHPEMVADLLRGFVREDWVRDLDFSTLERVSGSYVTPELRGRESDIVWRVRWGRDRWLYVYLLIEFQSTVDPFMALRVLVYLGLLYQDLVQHRQLTPTGKLPPVLPLVLYNGSAPWGAVRELAELIEEVPGGLEQYRPRLRYCLLDEAQIADSELESLRNLAAALFRLEKSRGPEDIQRILTALIEWLQEPVSRSSGDRSPLGSWVFCSPAGCPGSRFPRSQIFRRSGRCSPSASWNGPSSGRKKGSKRGAGWDARKGARKGTRKGWKSFAQFSCGTSKVVSVPCRGSTVADRGYRLDRRAGGAEPSCRCSLFPHRAWISLRLPEGSARVRRKVSRSVAPQPYL